MTDEYFKEPDGGRADTMDEWPGGRLRGGDILQIAELPTLSITDASEWGDDYKFRAEGPGGGEYGGRVYVHKQLTSGMERPPNAEVWRIVDDRPGEELTPTRACYEYSEGNITAVVRGE